MENFKLYRIKGPGGVGLYNEEQAKALHNAKRQDLSLVKDSTKEEKTETDSQEQE